MQTISLHQEILKLRTAAEELYENHIGELSDMGAEIDGVCASDLMGEIADSTSLLESIYNKERGL